MLHSITFPPCTHVRLATCTSDKKQAAAYLLPTCVYKLKCVFLDAQPNIKMTAHGASFGPRHVQRWICANGGMYIYGYQIICHLKQPSSQNTHYHITDNIEKEKNKKKLRGVCLICSGCSKAGIPFTLHLCHFNHSQPLTVRQTIQKFKTKQVGKVVLVEQVIATPGHVVEESLGIRLVV